MSQYVVQIAHAESGEVVASWPPRSIRLHGAAEQYGPFIDALCARVEEKGIGIGRTSAHGIADLRAAWQELLHELKTNV